MEKQKANFPRDLRGADLSSATVLDVREFNRRGHRDPEDRVFAMSSLFWNERRRIARAAIVSALITLIVALFMSNTYESATRLMPPEKNSSSGMAAIASVALGMKGAGSSGGSELGSMAGDLLGMQSSGALFVGVLHSRTAQEKVVDQFDLQSVYGHPWLHWKVGRESARKELEGNTEISEDRKSGIITVKVTDQDPKRAAALTQAYVNQLDDLLAHLGTSSAGRERQFLEGELAKVQKDLNEADRQLSQYSSQHATLDPREQGKAMMQAATSLQGELIAAESSLRGLQAIYTNNNVRVRTLQARIAELKKQLANVSGGGVEGGAEGSNQGSNSEFGFPSIRQLPLLSVTYADLYRKARIQETVYQFLTQQYETARVQEAKEIPTVRVLDAANVPETKSGPHRVLLTLLGGIFGLLIGCAWVTGWDRWRKRSDGDPYKMLFTNVGETFRKQPAWQKGEAGLRRALELSRARMPALFRNGSWETWSGNGTDKNGPGENGAGNNGSND
jgi:capsule polysaccharide export protein KpsE/RkpR